jgi:hypothetical protein
VIVIRNSYGTTIFENVFAQSVEFISKLTRQKWILTNIYAPCIPDGKLEFLRWFRDINISNDQFLIIMEILTCLGDLKAETSNKKTRDHRTPPI